MITTKAIYHDAILPEHRGNPLIEALPVKVKDSDVIGKFCNLVIISQVLFQ